MSEAAMSAKGLEHVEDMKIEWVDLEVVKAYHKNPRKNDQTVDELAKWISKVGWRQPIVVDKDKVIVVGHTRWKAAKKLGCKRVPIHVAENLTKAQIKAYRIADNRVHELSEWEGDLLKQELDELVQMDSLFDLNFMNFSLQEIDEKGKEESWDFSEVQDQTVITITVPLAKQPEVMSALKKAGISQEEISLTNIKK
jgi:site-specific DNA-methyltransferase (adenine-specific)